MKQLLVSISAALFLFTAVATPTADATPIDHLVDCAESFWAIACGLPIPDPLVAPAPTAPPPAATVDRVAIVPFLPADADTYLRAWDGRVVECADLFDVPSCVPVNTGDEVCRMTGPGDFGFGYGGSVSTVRCLPVPCLVDVPHENCPTLAES